MNDRSEAALRKVGAMVCGGCLLLGAELRADEYRGDSATPPGKTNVLANGGFPTGAQLAAAAKAYGCSEEEAAAMLQQVRPEMRGAFLAGKLNGVCRTPADTAAQAARGEAVSEPTREQIVQTMNEINQRAIAENWPAAKAGVVRREYARRLGTNAVSLVELRAWVEDPNALPAMAVRGQ